MTKNKEQNLLQFPSALNVEPGGKGEVRPVENPDEPDWKREVARKVLEHQQRKKAKEGIENLKRLDEVTGQGSISEADRQTIKERFAESRDKENPLAVQGQLLAERFPGKKAPPRTEPAAPPPLPEPPAPPVAPAPPSLPFQDPITDKNLRERLIESHQQMFRNLELSADEKLKSQEERIKQPFDRLTLTKTPPSPATEGQDLTEPGAEEDLSRDDYALSLDQILERRRQRPVVARRKSDVDRTILLSRVLSGLIDLIVVLALAVGFLVMVSLFTNAPLFAPRMGILLAGLFIMVQYAYGIFFLPISGQTLGMVVVGLQVVQGDKKRLTPVGAIVRVSVFLLALGCALIGLVWGLVDREARCWQDILSDSRVIRS